MCPALPTHRVQRGRPGQGIGALGLHLLLLARRLLSFQPLLGWAGLWTGSEVPHVLQVAVTDLCPAGPLQAVEIQVESSSLANMCQAHHAIIGRMQVCQSVLGSVGKSAGWWEHGTMVVCGYLPQGSQDNPSTSSLGSHMHVSCR